MGDVMVLVDSEGEDEEEEDREDIGEEEQETNESEELPKETCKHGHIHRVTALVNGNLDRMGNGLKELHGKLACLLDAQTHGISFLGGASEVQGVS